MTDERVRVAETRCPRCGGTCVREIDRAVDRYLIGLPASCPSKDDCERLVMAGFQFVPDRDAPESLDEPVAAVPAKRRNRGG